MSIEVTLVRSRMKRIPVVRIPSFWQGYIEIDSDKLSVAQPVKSKKSRTKTAKD